MIVVFGFGEVVCMVCGVCLVECGIYDVKIGGKCVFFYIVWWGCGLVGWYMVLLCGVV